MTCANGCGQPASRLFCSTACRRAFHNLQMKRGAVLTPLVLTWRGGKRGAGANSTWAFREFCALADRWRAEDAKAGRRTDDVMTAKREGGWLAVDLD
jgi:hypothetical protein